MKNLLLLLLLVTLPIHATTYIKNGAMHEGVISTATSGGNTALSVSSRTVQQFTGALTHTAVLPDATTLAVGRRFKLINRSTQALTVNSFGGALLQAVPSGSASEFIVTSIATSAGTWDAAVSMSPNSPEFSGAVTLSEIATPANPLATKFKLYMKTDGKLYRLNSLGAEAAVGSLSGPGSTTDYGIATWNGVGGSALRDSTLKIHYDNSIGEMIIGQSASGGSGNFSTRVGFNTTNPGGNGNTTLGYNVMGSVGTGANLQTAVGSNTLLNASGSPVGTTAMGAQIDLPANSSYNSVFGASITSAIPVAYSIGLGYQAILTAFNQMVVGSDNAQISDAYFGKGVVSTTAATADINFNGTGGLGTDVDGADVRWAGGKNTGAGVPGKFIISTGTAGASSAILSALTDRLVIDGAGLAAFSGPITATQFNGAFLQLNSVTENFRFGLSAIPAVTSGTTNTVGGLYVGTTLSTGTGNTLWGNRIGDQFTNHSFVTSIGHFNFRQVAGGGGSSVGVGYFVGANLTSVDDSVMIGNLSGSDATPLTSATRVTFLGNSSGSTQATAQDSIALGYGSKVTANNQFVAGSPTTPITSLHFGSGVTSATAATSDVTINATGGLGTDIAGADLILAGGKNTGNEQPGAIRFATGTIGASGPGLSALTDRVIISDGGFSQVKISVVGGAAVQGGSLTAPGYTFSADFGSGISHRTIAGGAAIGVSIGTNTVLDMGFTTANAKRTITTGPGATTTFDFISGGSIYSSTGSLHLGYDVNNNPVPLGNVLASAGIFNNLYVMTGSGQAGTLVFGGTPPNGAHNNNIEYQVDALANDTSNNIGSPSFRVGNINIRRKLTMGDITTPSAPTANQNHLYFKGGLLYYQTSSSGEQLVDTSGAGDALLGTLTTLTNVPATGTWGDMGTLGAGCVISVPAGDWDLTLSTNFQNPASGSGQTLIAINTSSGATCTGCSFTDYNVSLISSPGVSSTVSVPPVANFRVNVNAATTYYGKINSTYGGTTPQYSCRMSARKTRGFQP